MRRYQNYPECSNDPLVALSRYRLDTRYRAAVRDRLVDAARSAQPSARPRFLLLLQRVGTGFQALGWGESSSAGRSVEPSPNSRPTMGV